MVENCVDQFLPMLGCPRAVQVVSEHGQFRKHRITDSEVLVAGASHVLGCLV